MYETRVKQLGHEVSMTRHFRFVRTLSDFIWAYSTLGTRYNLRDIGDELQPRYAVCGCYLTTLVYSALSFGLRQSFTALVKHFACALSTVLRTFFDVRA